MDDPISVIQITYVDEVFVFDDSKRAAEYLEEYLYDALAATDLGPSYFGQVDLTIEIVEMERSEYEALKEAD